MVKGGKGAQRGVGSSRGPPVVHSPTATQKFSSERRPGALHDGDGPSPSSTRLPHVGAASSSQTPPQIPEAGNIDDSVPGEGCISREESDKLVAEVMRHMLFKNRQQPNVPVKRDELSQLVTKTYKQRQLTSFVINTAQKKLLAIFGFEMKELTRTRSSKTLKCAQGQGPGAVDTKEYVLKSVIPDTLLKKHVETADSASVLSLAILIVCVIKFAGGEKVPEETLLANLKRMGVTEESEHPVFGNLKNALETVAKQRYIQKEKMSGNDGEGFVYELAEGALDESFKNRLDVFISQIVNKSG